MCDLNFKLYEDTKISMIGMIGLQPQSVQEERDSILSVLNNQKNIEQAIHTELDQKNSKFYVIEKEFWDSWVDNVNFKGDKSSFAIRKQKKNVIDNLGLIEEGHQYRLKEEVNYNEDFIIVTKFVFASLSTWYECNLVIQRNVIKKSINSGDLIIDQ